MTRYLIFPWLLLAAMVSSASSAGVKIDKVKDYFIIATDVYTAKVNSDGGLNSLVIEGVEFMAPPTEIVKAGDGGTGKCILPSFYACPMNNWRLPSKLPGSVELRDGGLHAEGNGWTLDYTFHPDSIDFSYSGTPENITWPKDWPPAPARSFRAGYPQAEIVISFAPGLDRACDPDNQGEFGWPTRRKMEPGNFAVLGKNGAGLLIDRAAYFHADPLLTNPQIVLTAPHQLVLLVLSDGDTTPKPITHRLTLFKKADLAHSLTMEICSPNPNHLFSGKEEVVFPVKVTALYGQTLHGRLAFEGSPYVWQTPKVVNEVPVDLTPEHPSVTIQLPIRPPKPGHYTGLIRVTDGTSALYSQRIGFLYRPEQIPVTEPPSDFDAFWDDNLAKLSKVPLDMTLEEQKEKETAVGIMYKVKYRSWDGRWAWAWLNVPKAEGKFPAKIICPPVSVWQPGQAGMAGGELCIWVAIHGGDLKDYPAKPDFDYMNTGITSRETYMLRYSYSCLARCFDIIRNHEKCNGEVNVYGSSQGGGLSLVLAGIRPVTRISGVVPALCRIDWTVLGHTHWGPACPSGEDPKKIAEVVRYFDPANFTHRIHAPVRLGFGLFDMCAPAEAIFSALNGLPKDTKCEIFADPYGGHFSFDSQRFNSNEPGLEIRQWQGTDADNKVVR